MSRYVSVDLSLALPTGHDALRDLLETLGLSVVPGPVSLTGSLECQGEPVDLKIDPGPYGTIEDFGFVLQPRARLVCGELDKRRLEAQLLPALTQAVAHQRIVTAAARAGLRVEATQQTAAGGRRIVLRRDD